jgi:hypothetical protein
MSELWLINAWRQQLKSSRAVAAALKLAKSRNLQRYALVRQGRHYWLACSAEASTSEQYDLAICVRRQFAKIRHGIYLALWQGQLVCVAWQEQQLLHCCAVEHDADGAAHIQLQLSEMKSGGRSDSALLLAKSAPAELEQFCRQQLSSWRLRVAQVDIQDLRLLKPARLRGLQQPTAGQQRQRLLLALLLACASAAMVAWYFWPQPSTADTTQPTQIAPAPTGLALDLLADLPRLFAGFEHLAGWQWQSAHLQGNRLTAQLRANYGRSEELLAQVASDWQLQSGKATTQLVAMLDKPRWSQPQQSEPWSVVAWQDNAQRYFPKLQVNAVQRGQDQWFQWQQWQLLLPTTSWEELRRVQALLTNRQLRIIGLKLSYRATLQLDLTLRHYELLQPAIEDPAA